VEEPVGAATPAAADAAAAPSRPAASKPPDRPAVPAAARGAPASGGFVVQVGSFSRRENAAVMVRQAAGKGVRLTVAGPDDRGLFRVRSAVVRTRQEAVALQGKLRAQGYRGLVGAVN
jgi:cell division septation protein DedD